MLLAAAIVVVGTTAAVGRAPAAGDPARGAKDFGFCAACHSLAPDRNMTGPSLAGVWGRKAGSLQSFERYSPALKAADVVWNSDTLDSWLKDPAAFIPHNRMTIQGIDDARMRADLIAYLKTASAADGAAPVSAAEAPDLKKLRPGNQVKAIRYCRDTYHVTIGDGQTLDFWERNLRFKTDSTDRGPAAGAPAIMHAGMQGDRASVIFATPQEIGTFIKHQC